MTIHPRTIRPLSQVLIDIRVSVVGTASKLWRRHLQALADDALYRDLVTALAEAILGRTKTAYRIVIRVLVITLAHRRDTSDYAME